MVDWLKPLECQSNNLNIRGPGSILANNLVVLLIAHAEFCDWFKAGRYKTTVIIMQKKAVTSILHLIMFENLNQLLLRVNF